MAPRNSSKAVAIVTALSVIASIAVLALATAGTTDAQAQGCTGGGGGSPSPSASAGGTSGPIPSIIPSLIPGSASPSPSPAPSTSPTQSSAPAPRDQMVPVAQPSGETTCRSTITIAYDAGRNPKFTGKVGSAEPMCKRGRDVTVKKVKRGADQTVGKGLTNIKGKYSVPARNGKGRFYAKVSKETTQNDDGDRITCQAAKSRTIRP